MAGNVPIRSAVNGTCRTCPDDSRNLEDGRLLLAIPKDGHLYHPTLELLAGSDIQFPRGPDFHLGISIVKNLPMYLLFLPPADIPKFVSQGFVDLGIIGREQVAEHEAGHRSRNKLSGQDAIEEVLDLGYGACKLQVQTREAGWVKRPEDLIGARLATGFVGLTKHYLERLEKGDVAVGVGAGVESKTRIQNVKGSAGVFCALGLADAAVDIPEPEEKMKAMGLKTLETLLESSAVLIRSKRVSNPKLVNQIAARFHGFKTAQEHFLCQYNIPRSFLSSALEITPGGCARRMTAVSDDSEWVTVRSTVQKSARAGVMDELAAVGARTILALDIANARSVRDPVTSRSRGCFLS